jgi:biotin carboxyl carrier protein
MSETDAGRPGRNAIRASVGRAHRVDADRPIVVEPLDRAPHEADEDGAARPTGFLVDGSPSEIALEGHRILVGAPRRGRSDGVVVREVVVDGWLIEVETEPAWRAELRERASRGAGRDTAGGPLEIRTSIPGRIVAVSVAAGDEVGPDEALVVLEAMKMQNEIRAGRHGIVERLAVGVGENVEVGDLLLVIR